MTHRERASRRRFLQSVGATALTMPFLRGLPAMAQSAADRRYLILLFTPNGIIRHTWGADYGLTNPGPSNFTLRSALMPLAKYQSRMIVLDGLQNKAASGGSHEAGMASLWTGVKTTGQMASALSIDQAIANQCGGGRPFHSIELMVRSTQDYTSRDVDTRMVYSGPAAPLDPRDNPVDAQSQIFAGIAPTSMPDPNVVRKTRVRDKVFAQLDTELTALTPRLCNEDRTQLEALRTGWQSLQTRFQQASATQCTVPALGAATTDFPTQADLQMQVLAMALGCDLTRVASLQFSQARSPMIPSWLSITDDHHSLSHMAPFPFQMPNPNMPPADVLTQYKPVFDKLTAIDNWYAQQVAKLAGYLDAIPAGSGKTLLDQTAIVWGNELDNGANHDHWNTPFVIVGGGGAGLKTGQYVAYPPARQENPNPSAGRAHNDLLVTLAQVMGCTSITSFGEPTFNTGPITDILA